MREIPAPTRRNKPVSRSRNNLRNNTSVLVIDDWGVSKLSAENRRDLLEIIEDRHGLSSTIVTSQLPVKSWHAVIGDPTLADAILDRLVHSAYQLNLEGESMRKTRGPLNQTDHFTP